MLSRSRLRTLRLARRVPRLALQHRIRRPELRQRPVASRPSQPRHRLFRSVPPRQFIASFLVQIQRRALVRRAPDSSRAAPPQRRARPRRRLPRPRRRDHRHHHQRRHRRARHRASIHAQSLLVAVAVAPTATRASVPIVVVASSQQRRRLRRRRVRARHRVVPVRASPSRAPSAVPPVARRVTSDARE